MDEIRTPMYNHRQSAIRQAREIAALQPIFLDTETTGLGYLDECIEIAIIDHTAEVLFHSRLKTTISIPPQATRIHGLRDQDVANCPTLPEVWATLDRIISGRHVASYNAEFDIRMIRQSMAAYKIPPIISAPGIHCIMEIYAEWHGDWSDYHQSYTWQSLSTASFRLLSQAEFESLPIHSALADAHAARLVLLAMAAQEIEEKGDPHA